MDIKAFIHGGLSLIGLFLILISIGCGDSSPIIIGFSGQLTGKMSDLGVHGRNGAILAIEKINANGGINGRSLKLISADDQNTAEGAIEADKELIEAGAIAIIGHMTSTQTIAVMPLISEKGIILVSPTTSTPKLTGKTDRFFRTMVENPIQSKELATYSRFALDVDTVLTISESDNQSYSYSFRDGFVREFEKAGGQILDNRTYSTSSPIDWNPIIDTLIALKPDAILLTCPAQDAVSFVQRVRNAGIKTQIISGAWAYTEKLLKWGGQYTEGMVFVIDFAADNPNPEYIKFREFYKNRFGYPPNFASAFSYEAILTLAAGLRKTGGDLKGLEKALAPSHLINGVIGPFKLNEFGDVERQTFIVTIRNGEFRTIEMR
ncbi:ABC transporter substrate-binding protein [Pseudodesulfovibrio piezophilus]|uniref:Extracellular ligand-binding receptor n=1 Tax=Pseudodesulfovibrio piezophilus (strain DSM 21447 / JCM 15486 / C1TLV30) TaxID=1322246 RepID=M1WQE8_PSEP2|nr:ABC transporter substrate-binding protein [Pseudodesulfovibrio piezophilus]CCH47667.1 Extracellular ligand-binding receptor [Pseudodesulfovibrio piezophilus C1TLV30]